MYACMYVCMYACMYVCMYIWIYGMYVVLITSTHSSLIRYSNYVPNGYHSLSYYHYRHVRHINLEGCGITRLGLQYISDSLCSVVHISTVTKLNLSNNFDVR